MRAFIILASAAIFCGGCSLSPLIGTDIVAYNKAVSDSSNKMMVLNVLRARNHAPLLFSSVQLVHGSLQAQGGTTLGFPFGNMPLKANDTLGITLGGQVSPTFDVSSLDTQDFTRGILQPVDPLVVKYFLDRGDVDPKIVLLLFFSELEDNQGNVIRIEPANAIRIQSALQDLSSGKVGGEAIVANAYSELTPVGAPIKPDKITLKDTATIDQSKYRLLPGEVRQGKIESYRLYAVSQTQKVAFCLKIEGAGRGSEAAKFILLGNVFSAERASSSSEDERCTKSSIKVDPAVRDDTAHSGYEKVTTRSVEGMIQFLGGVLRWEEEHGKAMTFDDFIRSSGSSEPAPTLFASNTHDILFSLNTEADDYEFSVDYNGKSYYVRPAAADQAGVVDHTLEVLALMSKLLDMNKSAKDLPVTQSVQIVP